MFSSLCLWLTHLYQHPSWLELCYLETWSWSEFPSGNSEWCDISTPFSGFLIMTVASLTVTFRLLLEKLLTEGLVAVGKCHLGMVCLNVKVVLRHKTEQEQSWGVTPLDGWPRDSVLELPGDALPHLGGQNVTMVNAVEIAVWLLATGSLAVSSLLGSFLLYASQSPSSVFAHRLLTTTAEQPGCPGDNFPMNSFHLGIGEAGEYPKGREGHIQRRFQKPPFCMTCWSSLPLARWMVQFHLPFTLFMQL